MLEEIYKGFSCPAEELDPEVLDAIVAARMQRVVDVFLERYAGPLAASSEGLVDDLSAWSSHDASLRDVWNTAFGMAERLVALEGPAEAAGLSEPVVYGARLALAMHAAGLDGGFRAAFPQPVRLRFDRFFLPATKTISVQGDRTSLAIDLNGGGRVAFTRAGDPGTPWQAERPADGQDELRQVPIEDGTVTFVTDEVLGDERQEGLTYGIAAATDEVADAWRAAFDLVRRCSPSYLQWIDRGIRDIVPVDVPGGAMVSGSHTQRWGEVYMTSRLQPLQFAEMLVHEVSHQHYFFGGFLAPVEDGSDTHLYYSPVKKTGRPIDKILLAYHAFANVILFYRQCREHGVETGMEESTILPELAQLEEPLRQTRGLTPLGRAFWEPLAERIAGNA
ncbi:MAG TPA: HEXXH motif-containing putative peptide modification protein [Thermoanaerobaculia bacterium]|nr:HEXXH motif-containing putative peptide modification protein [Thermoanaerobaculia bacterium]